MQISVLTIPVHAGQLHFTPSYFPNHDGSSHWPGPFPAWPLSCPLLPLSSQPSPNTFQKSSWQNYPNLLTCVRGEVMCAAGHEWDGAASTLAVVTKEPYNTVHPAARSVLRSHTTLLTQPTTTLLKPPSLLQMRRKKSNHLPETAESRTQEADPDE